jgi:general secretion pathway protein M
MSAAARRILGRLAALGLLLAVPALIYAVAILPVQLHVGALHAEATSLEEALQRYQRIVGQRAELAAQMRQATADKPDAASYLEASSDALAAAQLQDLLKQIVLSSGGTLDSVRVLQSTVEGPYRRVSVQLLIETRIDGLRALLYGVETRIPYLFVKNISVNSISGVRPDSPASEPADLDVRLEVFGYRKG